MSRLGGGSVADWEIGLVDDGLTDETARTLAMHLSRCNANRLVLDVSHNAIQNPGWEALAKAMGKISNLTFRCNNNPIGEHAPPIPCAWFVHGTIHTLCLEMEGCNLRFIDHWVVQDAAVPHQWKICLIGNFLMSHQLRSMRQRGWIVDDGYDMI